MSTITRTKNGQTVTIDFKDSFICISTKGYELNISLSEYEDLTKLVNEVIQEAEKKIERPKFPENR
jgi:hypothetical protein